MTTGRFVRVAHGDRYKLTVHPTSALGEVWLHVIEHATQTQVLMILSNAEAQRLAEMLVSASQTNRGN